MTKRIIFAIFLFFAVAPLAYAEEHKAIDLTAEELAWIADHPRIRVHNEMDWPPFNFAEAGKPQGFSIDVMNLLAKKVGIEVEYVTGPTWNEFLEMMKAGELDVMLNIVKTPERQKYLLFTPPYANNPNTILSQRDNTYKSVEQLFGKTVAVPKGFFYEEILKRDYPQIKVLAVKNMLESMKAVSFGNADAAFGELAVFDHLMNQHLMTNLMVAGDLNLGNAELTLLNIAARKDLPILASILTKGVNSITREERRNIQGDWFGDTQSTDQLVLPEREALNQANFILQYVAIIFAVLLVIGFATWLARGRPKQLTIRETLFVVFFIFAGLIVSIGTLVTLLLEGEQEQSKIEVRRDTSFNLALELKQSSDDLTRFARTFAVTGDPIYEKYYQAIIAIRDGKRAHPKAYTRSYWDHVAAGIVELDEEGEVYSLEQKMLDLGFAEDEQKKLSQAKDVSDALVNLETISMNAVNGRFKDARGAFSVEGKPNLEMARQLLHGKQYHDAKARIMRPIDDFFILLAWRTTSELNQVRQRNEADILAITILTAITIAFAFYAFFLLKRRVISPLSLLEAGALTLKGGDYSNRVDITSTDEVGTLAQSFNSMARGIEERTKEVAEKEQQLRSAMDELILSKEAAEKANLAKSEFLSSMSHELRTPLNAILGFAQLLVFNPKEPLTLDQNDSVNQITKGGKHLLELINDVLDLAQIESGKLDLSIVDVDTDELIDECMPLAESLAQQRDITVEANQRSGETVRADSTRLTQVLLNLISNAVKYNCDAGTVTVECAVAPNSMLRISVTDTGQGIPLEDQQKLFQPFSRLGAEETEIEGTGIGLVITKRLMEAMGGRIGFESTPGKGSTFWIEAPLSETLNIAGGEAADTDETAGPVVPEICGKVVYIEDNPANITLMESILGHIAGIDLQVAHNAELGLILIKKEKPDLVLMDINLPGMNGIEALGELRADPQTSKIPVIAISAAAMPADVEKGLKAGFMAYVTKPFNIPEILETIEDALKT